MNKRTVALGELMAALVGDLSYQHRLRHDFIRRRVHHSVEALAWAYAIGKPVDRVEMSGNASVNRQLAAEREVLSKLSVEQLEALEQESQALIAKARAMAEQRQRGLMSPRQKI